MATRPYIRQRSRSAPDERNAVILAAAMDEAEENGYQWITRTGVARRAGMAPATVSLYGDMITLKRDVLREAVRTERLAIIRQGLGDNHPIVIDAPMRVRRQAMAEVVGRQT